GAGDTERQEWRAQGERIGWLNGDDLLLDPDAAYAAAQKLARDQGTSLPVTQRTLWRRMDERGLLVVEDEARQRRLTVKRLVEGQRRRVLVLNPEALISQDRGNRGGRDKAASDAGFGPQNPPLQLDQTGAQTGENRGATVAPPLKQGHAPRSNDEQGRDSEPESLVSQGPAPSAPVAPALNGISQQDYPTHPCSTCGGG